MQATFFDNWIAGFVRWTGIPVAATELFWQFASIAADRLRLLGDCAQALSRGAGAVGRRCPGHGHVHAAGGRNRRSIWSISICTRAPWPRALILLAVSRILAGKNWQAVPLPLLAFLLHPIMAALGISFCFFLCSGPCWSRMHHLAARWPGAGAEHLDGCRHCSPRLGLRAAQPHLAAGSRDAQLPLSLPLGPGMSGWAHWRRSFLFWLLWRIARKRGETLLARFALAVFLYGVFQHGRGHDHAGHSGPDPARSPAADALSASDLFLHDAGRRLPAGQIPAQGQRLALGRVSAGHQCGHVCSRRGCCLPAASIWNCPDGSSANPWLQAFAWIRQNTPTDAYFALDPEYMAAPGEDYHSFRALAERSQLAVNRSGAEVRL